MTASSDPRNFATGSAIPPSALIAIMPTRSFPAGAISEDALSANTGDTSDADRPTDSNIPRQILNPNPPNAHRPGLFKLHLHDLVRPRPARGGDFDGVALALADQGARNRRGERDASLSRVGF